MSTPSPSRAEAATAPRQSILWLFAVLMLVMLLASLNQTVLAPALPTMVGDLNGVEHMAWVITAFILASTVVMPIYGKVGDLVGRKPLLVLAIGLFTVGSVIGALADGMATLITARAVQGLGGGGLMILSQAAIADVIPARDRGRYMGAMGGVFALSSVAGPLLGGWFTEGPGWRWAFWMNVPLGAVAVLAVVLLLHTHRPAAASRPRIDYPGMALLSVVTTALVLAVTWGGHQYAWGSPTILALFAVVVVGALLFAYVESRASEPVMPLSLFRDMNFNLTTFAGLLVGVAMFGALGYMPTYLQMATGADATTAGLLMIPMMGGLLVTSVAVGQLVSRSGRYKVWPVVGAVVLALGLALLSTLEPDSPTALICLYLAVMGVGIGANMQILVLIVQNSFPLRMVGTATAANNYFRQVGATLGSALVGSLFTARLTDLLQERLPGGATGTAGGANSLTPELVGQLPAALRAPVVESYNDALIPLYLSMVPLGVLAAVVLLFVREKPLATTLDDTPSTGIPTEPPEVGAGAAR